MKPVRVGCIGLGWITQRAHLPALAALAEEGQVVFQAFCDKREETLQEQAAVYKPHSTYTDHHQMFAGTRTRRRVPVHSANSTHRRSTHRRGSRRRPVRRKATDPRLSASRRIQRRNRKSRHRIPSRLRLSLRAFFRADLGAIAATHAAPRPNPKLLQRSAHPLLDQPLRTLRRLLRRKHHPQRRSVALLARRH